jgi:hypothetical protein
MARFPRKMLLLMLTDFLVALAVRRYQENAVAQQQVQIPPT